jgi:pimeloyl-ACP methyl ester carboxylesterase
LRERLKATEVPWARGRRADRQRRRQSHLRTCGCVDRGLFIDGGASIGRSLIRSAISTSARVSVSYLEQEKILMSHNTAFILIHGSWHGAWCYEKVANILAVQGYLTIALDLPGHGLSAQFPASYFQRPLTLAGAFNTEPSLVASVTLDDYVQHVVSTIHQVTNQGKKVVLVGHSLAGIVLNAIGEKLGYPYIERLVYLSAFMPPSNCSTTEIIARSSQADSGVPPLLLADPAQIGALRLDPHSADPGYQSRLKSTFYADMSDTDFLAIAHFLTPDDPAQPFAALVSLSPQQWGRIPRTYIQCSEDWAVRPATQAQMIADADAFTPDNPTQVISLTSSHSPFFSQPEKLANALILEK